MLEYTKENNKVYSAGWLHDREIAEFLLFGILANLWQIDWVNSTTRTLYPGTIHRPLETSWAVFSSIDFSAAATSSYNDLVMIL